MKRHTIPSLSVILLLAASGAAQSSGKRPSASQGSEPVTDIRKVDFLNFTYQPTTCSKEYGKAGIGKSVRVRSGEFKNRKVYFAVEEGKTLFGDLTGDGRDDAVVQVGCGATTANFALTEIYVYTITDGRTTLLAGINDETMERDLRSAYPETESYWGLAGTDLKMTDGNLDIDVLLDGSHASPKYVTTLAYHWDGKNFRLTGKPERRSA
jgi:hypothetical protein